MMPTSIPTSDHANIENLVRQIVELVDPLRIILFGSTAREETSKGSDVDLLVVMPEGTPRRDVMLKLYDHISGSGVPYNIIVTTPKALEKHKANPGLIYIPLLNEGREVYTEEEHNQAVHLAQTVVEWADRHLSSL